jgi:hypothetical protein
VHAKIRSEPEDNPVEAPGMPRPIAFGSPIVRP